jgi:hypothetical protein
VKAVPGPNRAFGQAVGHGGGVGKGSMKHLQELQLTAKWLETAALHLSEFFCKHVVHTCTSVLRYLPTCLARCRMVCQRRLLFLLPIEARSLCPANINCHIGSLPHRQSGVFATRKVNLQDCSPQFAAAILLPRRSPTLAAPSTPTSPPSGWRDLTPDIRQG